METLLIFKNLDHCVENIRGKIILEENFLHSLNEQIEAYYTQYGILPKIELAYGFLPQKFATDEEFGIQQVFLRFQEANQKLLSMEK